jgi:hypothetical protein
MISSHGHDHTAVDDADAFLAPYDPDVLVLSMPAVDGRQPARRLSRIEHAEHCRGHGHCAHPGEKTQARETLDAMP